jgi:hypothetical protein
MQDLAENYTADMQRNSYSGYKLTIRETHVRYIYAT